MVTVLGIASLDLTKTQQKELVYELGKTVDAIFGKNTFMLRNLPHENCAGIAKDQITFFISVDEDIDIDIKRNIVKSLNEVMVKTVGYKGDKKVIAIFRYRDDIGYSENGKLIADIK